MVVGNGSCVRYFGVGVVLTDRGVLWSGVATRDWDESSRYYLCRAITYEVLMEVREDGITRGRP